MSQITHEGINFSMSHPLNEDWFNRGIERLPNVAVRSILSRYENSKVDGPALVDAVDIMTSSATATRQAEELGNLWHLGLGCESSRDQYASRAGVASEIAAQIGWFAAMSHQAFRRPQDEYARTDKITLDLGGVRQYGLWKNNGEITSKEVDDATWYLADNLRSNFKGADIKSFEYEGATPIRYRAFRAPHNGVDPAFVVGRRRRAVLDITLGGQVIHVFKQFRGLIPLDLQSDEYRKTLLDQYSIPSKFTNDHNGVEVSNPQFIEKTSRINRVVGTIMREAIMNKDTDPLTVCPVDVHLVMSAQRG